MDGRRWQVADEICEEQEAVISIYLMVSKIFPGNVYIGRVERYKIASQVKRELYTLTY